MSPPPDAGADRIVPRRAVWAIAAAAAVALPGLVLRIGGSHPAEIAGVVVFGASIIGAAFLLAWGAEALQLDVSRGLALAVLALIAVLPEYIVDFTFASKAGQNPGKYAPLALANMTGSNRLLIGVGWPLVVFLGAWRVSRIARRRNYTGEIDTSAHLDRSQSIEISFLAVATLYSLTLPLKSRLALYDTVVLVALYLVYAWRVSHAPSEPPHLVGPARLFGMLTPARRRTAVGLVLLFAGTVIIASAEPFADSLVDTGRNLGVSTFLLVQWLAPLASESPELLVAALFAWRLHTKAGLGTLVSSKVNQWTLLVGTLPIVFVIAGGAARGLPLDHLQREELFLTAAQSAFAVSVLASRSISVREAWALLVLFVSQFALGAVLPEAQRHWERIGVGIAYLVLAAALIVVQRRQFAELAQDGFRTPAAELMHEREREPEPEASLP